MLTKRHFLQIIWYLSIFIAFAFGAFPLSGRTQSKATIHFLFTSDLHGWLTSAIMYPRREHYGLLHLKNQISLQKKQIKDLILIDAGDLLQGSPLSFFYQHQFPLIPEKNPFFRLFNELQFDAVIVGNHDLALNPQFENTIIPKSEFKWLAANLNRHGNPVFTPYIVRHVAELKIVILGFTTPGIHLWLGPSQLNGLEAEELEKSVLKWVQLVNTREKPDFLLGVFHVGINPYRDDENSKISQLPKANNLRSILEKHKLFDFVLSGHDHRLIPDKSEKDIPYINGTPVVSAGSLGRSAMGVTVELRSINRKWKVNSIKTDVIKSRKDKMVSNDPFLHTGQDYKSYISEVLPWFWTDTTKEKGRRCLNHLVALSNDRPELSGTLFPSVIPPYVNYLKGRNIIRADLFDWIRYDNKAITIRLSKRDLHLLTNPDPEYGYKKIAYNRILEPWLKSDFSVKSRGLWLEREEFVRKYLFKITDYHYWGGGGIIPQLALNEDDLISISQKFIRDNLFEYLEQSTSLPETCYFLQYNPVH